MGDDFKQVIENYTNQFKNVLEETHNEALALNEIQTQKWLNYKKDHEELSVRLLSMRDKLSHSIMVPVGKIALIRGKLVHTNEILVCLGDGWFAKRTAQQAAEICKRRILQSEETLDKLQKEEKLLSTRKSLPFEAEVFGSNQGEEIIEPYNEEEEKLWRERHRQKEKEYRQKLASIRNSEREQIQSDEDFMKRLDSLDLQEELEDELNRLELNGKADLEGKESTSESEETESGSDESSDDTECETDKKHTKRVTFEENQSDNYDIAFGGDRSNDDDIIRIYFNHSNASFTPTTADGQEITNPTDLLTQYKKQKIPKSILKPSPLRTITELPEQPIQTNISTSLHKPAIKVISDDVVERQVTTSSVVSSDRPASRFKAARNQKILLSDGSIYKKTEYRVRKNSL